MSENIYPVILTSQKMKQDSWEKYISKAMVDSGWALEENTQKHIGFGMRDKFGDIWVRRYEKASRKYIHFNFTETKRNIGLI